MRDVGAALDNEHVKWKKDEEKRREKMQLAVVRFEAEAARLKKLEILSDGAHKRATELAQKLTNEGYSSQELALPENFTEALQKMMDEQAERKMQLALKRAEERAAKAEAAFKQKLLDQKSAAEGTEANGDDKGAGATEGKGTTEGDDKGNTEGKGTTEGADKGAAETKNGEGGTEGADKGEAGTEGKADDDDDDDDDDE